MWLYLKNKTNLSSDRLRLLHFAPEYVIRKQLAASSNLDDVTIDLDSLMPMVKADITNLPFTDAAFDVVLRNRVLKPGGWAILQVPLERKREQTFEDLRIVSPEDREKWFHQEDHVRIYGLDYKDRLEAAGFKVSLDYYAKELPEELRTRYALLGNRPIYYCTKAPPAPL